MSASPLADRLQRRLASLSHIPDPKLRLVTFRSRRELQEHLSEGALLNVSVLASRALSVPCGEYLVWSTDLGNTVLIPTAAVERPGDVITHESPTYEVHTNKILGSWNRIERTISEHAVPDNTLQESDEGEAERGNSGHFAGAPVEQPSEPYTFGSAVGRTSLWQAMRRANLGVNDLADRVGVDPSTISRLLRDIKRGAGDPGGRNPSVALAQEVASVLGCDIDEVLPPAQDLELSQRSATSGSGRGGSGKTARRGGASYSQGNVGESTSSMTVEELLYGKSNQSGPDRTRGLVYHVARLLEELHIDPFEYLSEQVDKQVSDRLLVLELKGQLGQARLALSEAGFGQKLAGWGQAAKRGLAGLGGKQQLDGPQYFQIAIGALKHLNQIYGGRGYGARMGAQKFGLNKFLGNVITNLTKIRDKMPEVEQKYAQQTQRQRKEVPGAPEDEVQAYLQAASGKAAGAAISDDENENDKMRPGADRSEINDTELLSDEEWEQYQRERASA